MAPYNYLDFSLKVPVSQPLEKKVPFKRPDLHRMLIVHKIDRRPLDMASGPLSLQNSLPVGHVLCDQAASYPCETGRA